MPAAATTVLINTLLGGAPPDCPQLHGPPTPWGGDYRLEVGPLQHEGPQGPRRPSGPPGPPCPADPLFGDPAGDEPGQHPPRAPGRRWANWVPRARMPAPGMLYRMCGSAVLAVAAAHAVLCVLVFTLSVGVVVSPPGVGRVLFEPVFFPGASGGGPRWWEPSERAPRPHGPLLALRVPRIIHQTYHARDLPPDLHPLVRSWQTVNPTWQVRFYDDAACLELVRREFPEYAEAYQSLPKAVERSDFFRYMVVLRYGGVYADVDTECKAPLDEVIRPEDELVAGWESEVGSDEEAFRRHYVRRRQVLQWVFAAAPGHPALRRVCDHIAASVGRVFSNNTNRDTLERTGPGAWTDAVIGAGMRGEGEGRWRVRLLPRVAFGVHPAGVDGLTTDSPGIVVQHHFRGSWKSKWGWRKKTLWTEFLGALGWSPPVVQDPIKDLGTDIFPVSVSFEPPFDMFVNLKGHGDVQSGSDVSESLSLWGAWQAGLDPTRGPRVVDILVGSLGTAIKELVFVDVGAGLGLFSLAAAARGHRAIAFEASASSLPALRASVEANGFQDLLDVHPMPLGHRNESACLDHPLQALRAPPNLQDQVVEDADFRRGYGNRSMHGMVHGCQRAVRRGTLDSLLREEMQIGALRVSASGWTGWILEGGLHLIRHHMPNAIHLEINSRAMRGAGYARPEEVLYKLQELGYEEAYHAGPVCDERWFNITSKARIKGPFSRTMEDKLSQPVWCNLPQKDFQLIVDRGHQQLAENVLFLYREGQGRRPARTSMQAGGVPERGVQEYGGALPDRSQHHSGSSG
eukprot:evm.model.scf_1171.5 EVM.evm.TU.scf_1171.5   scf_1171:27804-30200(+)